MKQQIFISRDEVEYILNWMNENKSEYIKLEYSPWEAPLAIWHNISIADQPYGEMHKIPLSDKDRDSF